MHCLEKAFLGGYITSALFVFFVFFCWFGFIVREPAHTWHASKVAIPPFCQKHADVCVEIFYSFFFLFFWFFLCVVV